MLPYAALEKYERAVILNVRFNSGIEGPISALVFKKVIDQAEGFSVLLT